MAVLGHSLKDVGQTGTETQDETEESGKFSEHAREIEEALM